MINVFQGFDKQIDDVSKRIRHTEREIKECKDDCCRYVVDIAQYINVLKDISSNVMSIADVLDMRDSKEVLRLIYSCKFCVNKVHNMCKLAYIKDASKGYERVLVSSELEGCVREYSDTKTEQWYTLPLGKKTIEVVIDPDVKGLTVVPVCRRVDTWA